MSESGSHRCPVDGRKVTPQPRRWWSPEVELAVTLVLLLLTFLLGAGVGMTMHSHRMDEAYLSAIKERDQWRTAYVTLHNDVEQVVRHFDANDSILIKNDQEILAELRSQRRGK